MQDEVIKSILYWNSLLYGIKDDCAASREFFRKHSDPQGNGPGVGEFENFGEGYGAWDVLREINSLYNYSLNPSKAAANSFVGGTYIHNGGGNPISAGCKSIPKKNTLNTRRAQQKIRR